MLLKSSEKVLKFDVSQLCIYDGLPGYADDTECQCLTTEDVKECIKIVESL